MMATTARRPGQPGGSAGMDDLSSSHSGSLGDQDGSAGGSSIPDHVDIIVILPNGMEKPITVDYHKQMMDLLVQVAVSNKLSPTSHTFSIINEETGRPVEFLASQSIGSLGVSHVYLVPKKMDKKDVRKPSSQPFEMTKRLTVNLPRNQKAVLRVSPNTTLAEIYKMICTEKSLDPYKYELRHPTQPDEPLNMACPLQTYGINEITVVPVGPDNRRSTSDLPNTSRYSSDVTFSTIPRNKGAATGPGPSGPADRERGYMPGMEKKKKKGIFSIFSRKKGGKFNVSDASYGIESGVASTAMAPPPTHTSTLPRSRSEQPLQTDPTLELPKQRPLSTYSTNSSYESSQGPKVIPDKPPRKKRQAPPPPPGTRTSLEVATEPINNAQKDNVHSRTSSHSSGFDETTNSPLESPGNSSRESSNAVSHNNVLAKTNQEASSLSAERTNNLQQAPTAQDMNKQISTTSVNSDTSTLSRTGKKKRKAPAPPGATKSVPSPAETTPAPKEAEVASPGDSAHSSPTYISYDVTVSSPPAPEKPEEPANLQEAFVEQQLKSALVEELKNGSIDNSTGQGYVDSEGQSQGDLKIDLALNNQVSDKSGTKHDEADQSEPSTELHSRPCEFIAPPPPDSPPPPQTPDSTPSQPPFCAANSVTVVDSTTQVHVTMRDSLSSEYSCCADDVSTDDDLPSDLNLGSSRSSAVSDFDLENMETNEHVFTKEAGNRRSEIAEFVEQMEELTENAGQESPKLEPLKDGGFKSVITINSENANYVNITTDPGRSFASPDSSSRSPRLEQDTDVSVVTDETSSTSSSTAMYVINAEKSEDSDNELEGLPYTGAEGVVLLKKEVFNEFKQTTPQVEIRDISNQSITHVSDPLDDADNKRDSVNSGDGPVTAEEISFADEVMASIEEREKDNEIKASTPFVRGPTQPTRQDDGKKKVLMPNFNDLSMDEEITFDFDQSDVMFVPPTPPKKDIAKEETGGGHYTGNIPEPIVESTMELEAIQEQPAEPEPFQSQDSFYEDKTRDAPEPVFDHHDLPPPPPELMENTHHGEESFTYTVNRNYSITDEPADNKQVMKVGDDDDDHDGFKVPVISLAKRKVDAAPAPINEVREPEPELAQVKSLRDAYRKPEKTEPETIIISKDKPLPVFQAKAVRELPEKRRISLATDTPRFDVHEKEEPDRRASMTTRPISLESNEPTDGDRHKVSFWGPRPWNARAKSEPSIKDVRMALSRAQEEEEEDTENMNHNMKGSQAREECSRIGYEPASAEENDSVLEEKSISLSMSSLPVQVERKSSYKEGHHLNRYGSSMGLLTNRAKPGTLDTIPAQSPVRPEEPEPKDKSKKTLYQQYGELQQQYSRWQTQIMQNQQLLAKKKIVPDEQGKPLESIGSTTVTVNTQVQESPRKIEVKRDTGSFVTSAARREERLSSSSSQSSGYGGLAGRFSPDELLSQKSLLKSNSIEEKGSSLRFNGDGTSSARITRQVSAPSRGFPREGSPPRKAPVTHTVSSPPVVPPAPPPAPPVPSVTSPPPPPPVAEDIDRPVKSWGPKVKAKRPQPKFEPQLSPREELMLAIRNAGGRGALKSVPVNNTN